MTKSEWRSSILASFLLLWNVSFVYKFSNYWDLNLKNLMGFFFQYSQFCKQISMLLMRFPLLDLGSWILWRNHNFCCVSTMNVTKPCCQCRGNIFLLRNLFLLFPVLQKQISCDKSVFATLETRLEISTSPRHQTSVQTSRITCPYL